MTKIHLLLVDDLEANLISLVDILENLTLCENIVLHKALFAEDALKIALKQKIDLIISDIQMPKINGFEMANILKGNKKTKDIPIIFLTAAFKAKEFEEYGFEVGAIDYFLKPIEKYAFLNKINLYVDFFIKNKQLEENNRYTNSILEASSEAQIIIDEFSNITDFNQKAQLVFKHIHTAIPLSQLFEEEEEEEEEEEFSKLKSYIKNISQHPDSTEIFKHNKNFFKVRCKQVHNNQILFFYNITKEIKEAKRKDAIFNSQDSIVVTTNGKQIIEINSKFFKLFDYVDKADFNAKHSCICDLFVDKENETRHLNSNMNGLNWLEYMNLHPEIEHEAYMVDKFGNEHVFAVKTSGQLFEEEEEEEEEEVIVFNDITELKEKNTLLLLQSKDAAIGEMISMIAHQWRQPLTILSAILSRVRVQKEMDMLDDIALNAAIEKSNAQIVYMSKTIDDFRDFSIDTDKKEKVALHEIIEVPKNLINTLLHSKNISFEVEYKDVDAQIHIETIISKLSQVFLNIYKNAIDQITLKEVEEGSIKVSVFFEKKTLCIEVCDNAGGIDEKAMKRLFEPYFSTKSKNGTGLGLYMSKKIVQEILGGNISASNKNGGACFKILLKVEI